MKKVSFKYTLLLSLLVFASSCISNKQKLYLQHDEKDRYEMVPFEQYKLVVNDEIIFYLMTASLETQSFYNGGDNNFLTNNIRMFRIYEDGCIVLPTVGRVAVAGLSLREAERVIRAEFKEIVPDAEVKIALANNYFYVQGDGGKGQFFMYKEKLNIFQALAMAGDISTIGSKKDVKIIRRGKDGFDHSVTVDLRKESVIESDFYYIRPNDVIYIPTTSRSFFRIDSITGFITVIATPLSLIALSLSFIDKK